MTVSAPRTLLDKLWDRHVVATGPGGRVLLYVDRHLVHEGSFHAFAALRESGRRVRRPGATFAMADHYVPTAPGAGGAADPEARARIDDLAANARAWGLTAFGVDDPRQGIVHVVGPELGITQPGLTVVCGDSHTSTHGAFGALAFGIGASEVGHVLATQTLWQRRPATMRVTVEGRLGPAVGAKDLALALIARIGTGGGRGHALEFAGSAVRGLSMEGRMTLCNMAIEAGSRTGLVAPDATTFAYLDGRPWAPRGEEWERALALWRSLPTDPGARFDREVLLDAGEVAPMVTWGTSPQDAVPVTGRVPDPAAEPDAGRRAGMERALAYMGLRPGTPLAGLPVDRVFIGSCTNGRLEDLRVAAAVARGRRAAVPALVVPGSRIVRRAAEAEGLDRVFREAGFEWREPGCSMCVAINGDVAAPGERVAATSNRNFEGRQGVGSRTHLMGPAAAAVAAVTGRIGDPRSLAG
jgi:3-isopropylmalate/(R)-2-methylmalate dehydratase large subunit